MICELNRTIDVKILEIIFRGSIRIIIDSVNCYCLAVYEITLLSNVFDDPCHQLNEKYNLIWSHQLY